MVDEDELVDEDVTEEEEGETPVKLLSPQEDPPDLIPEAAGGSLARPMARARAFALGEPMPE